MTVTESQDLGVPAGWPVGIFGRGPWRQPYGCGDGPHNQGTIELLEDLEITLGHDLWAEEEGREHVQHWDCQNCGAVLERRFLDGLVTGAALTEPCTG